MVVGRGEVAVMVVSINGLDMDRGTDVQSDVRCRNFLLWLTIAWLTKLLLFLFLFPFPFLCVVARVFFTLDGCPES